MLRAKRKIECDWCDKSADFVVTLKMGGEVYACYLHEELLEKVEHDDKKRHIKKGL